MERGVEDGDLWNSRPEHRPRGADSAEIVRVVQRGELDEILDLVPDPVVDERRPAESLSTVNDAMSDGLNFADRRDRDARVGAGQPFDDEFDGGGVVADHLGGFLRSLIRARECDDRFTADALDLAAGDATVARLGDRGLVGIDELEFERRGANVENEDMHVRIE